MINFAKKVNVIKADESESEHEYESDSDSKKSEEDLVDKYDSRYSNLKPELDNLDPLSIHVAWEKKKKELKHKNFDEEKPTITPMLLHGFD